MDATGNGTTATYNFTFRIFSQTDLRVVVVDADGVETTLTLTTHYTVTGGTTDSGGSITLVAGSFTWLDSSNFLETNATITIRRVRPLTQLADIRNQGDFFPEIHEDEFDKLVMVAQQQQDEIDRSVKIPESIDPSTFDGSLPTPLTADYFLKINSTGNGFNVAASLDTNIAVSSGTGILSKTSASAATPRTIEGTDGKISLTNGDGVSANPTINIPDSFLKVPGNMHNLSIQAATTTSSNDSIKITSADGTALSSSNPGFICLPSATAGQLVVFSLTADVTIDLTGAHWGLGTNGDATDYLLSVYAINDAGTIKWGVASIPNHTRIQAADDEATATNVTTLEKVLVNSALSGESVCSEIGWFKANFDDTGGASEDLWAVQTSIGDINLGPRPQIPQEFTPSGSWTSNTTYSGYWYRSGGKMKGFIKAETSGAPTSTIFTANVPSGVTIDTARLPGATNNEGIYGAASLLEGGTRVWNAACIFNDISGFRLSHTESGNLGLVNQANPFTWGSSDSLDLKFEVPIVNWD